MDRKPLNKSYQGIAIYLKKSKLASQQGETLQTKLYLSEEQPKFQSHASNGCIPVEPSETDISRKIVASKWLDKPVDRGTISKISAEMYNTTLDELASKYPAKRPNVPDITIDFRK